MLFFLLLPLFSSLIDSISLRCVLFRAQIHNFRCFKPIIIPHELKSKSLIFYEDEKEKETKKVIAIWVRKKIGFFNLILVIYLLHTNTFFVKVLSMLFCSFNLEGVRCTRRKIKECLRNCVRDVMGLRMDSNRWFGIFWSFLHLLSFKLSASLIRISWNWPFLHLLNSSFASIRIDFFCIS